MAGTRICMRLAGIALCLAASSAAAWTPVSDPARRGQAPEVAVGPDGAIHVIWLDKGPLGTADPRGDAAGRGHSHQSFTDLMYARSEDGGAGFSTPVRVNARDGEVWGFAVSKPRIGVGPTGVIHVFYPANSTSAATGKPVASSVYVRSTDGGRTFSPPLQLNGDGEQDLSDLVHGGIAQAHVFGTMTVTRDDRIHTFWLDTREMRRERPLASVYQRSSPDGGASFGEERRLFLADTCPCCQLTAAASGGGAVYLGSRGVSPGDVRMPTVTATRDGGATFGERIAVGGTPWQIDGCPLKPTALAAEDRFVYTLVHNGAEQPPGLLFARSTDGGRSFGPAVRVHPEAAVSDSPALAATSRGLYAFWHAKAGGERRIFMQTSTDHGESFSPVSELPAPGGTGSYPAAAPAPDGGAVVVWQQGEQILAAKVYTPVSCKSCAARP